MHSDAVAILAPVHCPMVLAYLGITGGTFCEVLVHGQGPGLISMMFPHLSLHILSTILSSVVCCQVCNLSSLESKISLTSYSISPSTCRGSGGGCCWRGNRLGRAGSSCDTWKTRWTEQNWHGRQRVMEWVPGFPIMLYGPRFFSESFLDGHLVLKNFTLM